MTNDNLTQLNVAENAPASRKPDILDWIVRAIDDPYVDIPTERLVLLIASQAHKSQALDFTFDVPAAQLASYELGYNGDQIWHSFSILIERSYLQKPVNNERDKDGHKIFKTRIWLEMVPL